MATAVAQQTLKPRSVEPVSDQHRRLLPVLAIMLFLVGSFSVAFVVQRQRDIAFQKFYKEKTSAEYALIMEQLQSSGRTASQEEVDQVFAALSQSTQNVSNVDMSTIFETLRQGEQKGRKDARKEFRSSRSL